MSLPSAGLFSKQHVTGFKTEGFGMKLSEVIIEVVAREECSQAVIWGSVEEPPFASIYWLCSLSRGLTKRCGGRVSVGYLMPLQCVPCVEMALY